MDVFLLGDFVVPVMQYQTHDDEQRNFKHTPIGFASSLSNQLADRILIFFWKSMN
jgi:hypothetical protein